jgi:hypothetical protein
MSAVTFAPVSPVTFALGLGLAIVASLAVFSHAQRHGDRHATAWGVAVFLFAGLFVPLYLVRVWLRNRQAGRTG